MEQIVKLDKSRAKEMAEVDLECMHAQEIDMTLEQQLARVNERFDENHELFFGYQEDSKLLGYASMKLFFPGHRHCEAYWIAVRSGQQGKGIGTKLDKHLEEVAREKGFRAIFCYTNKNNKEARKLYERVGYEFVNEFPEYYGYDEGENTSVLYRKWL